MHYLGFRHPNGGSLLLVNGVRDLGVPDCLGGHVGQVEGGSEDVAPKAVQLLGLLEQLLGRHVSLLGKPGSAILDRLLGLGLGEDDNGVELCVVKLVHSVGSHVQQSMFPMAHYLFYGRQPNDRRFCLGSVFKVVF